MNKISIPKYTLGEELVNSISHGIGAGLSIAALVLCLVKANNAYSIVSTAIYGSIMIVLYVISFIYHALSPRIKGKKVLRSHIKKYIENYFKESKHLVNVNVISIERFETLNFNNVWNKDDYDKFILKLHN